MIQVVTPEQLLIINVIDSCFISIPRAEMICKLANVECATICQHLTQFTTKKLLPLVLTHYQNEVGVQVLFNNFSHRVRILKVVNCVY